MAGMTAFTISPQLEPLEQKTIKHVAWRLIPVLMLAYFCAYLDRVNGSTIFLFCICSEPNETTTYFVPSPRKPPTDNTANGAFSFGVTIRSSIDPTVSLASLTTNEPTIFDERKPVATVWGSIARSRKMGPVVSGSPIRRPPTLGPRF